MGHTYFLDENIGMSLSRALTASDVAHIRIQDSEMFGAPDPDILAWTAARGLVIVTQDRNTLIGFFWAYLERSGFHPGLVLYHDKYRNQVGRIAAYLQGIGSVDLSNNVWWFPTLPSHGEREGWKEI